MPLSSQHSLPERQSLSDFCQYGLIFYVLESHGNGIRELECLRFSSFPQHDFSSRFVTAGLRPGCVCMEPVPFGAGSCQVL